MPDDHITVQNDNEDRMARSGSVRVASSECMMDGLLQTVLEGDQVVQNPALCCQHVRLAITKRSSSDT